MITAVTPGTAGNSITVALTNPGVPNAALSTSVNSNAITVSLATDSNSRAISTADEVRVSINAAASSLVSVSTVAWGFGYMSAFAATALAGGLATERFYSLAAVSVIYGGESGDVFELENLPERTVTL